MASVAHAPPLLYVRDTRGHLAIEESRAGWILHVHPTGEPAEKLRVPLVVRSLARLLSHCRANGHQAERALGVTREPTREARLYDLAADLIATYMGA